MAMQPNYLKVHELDYEIKIRDVVPTGNSDDKRKILRGLLSQADANRSFYTIKNPYLFATDAKEAQETLDDLLSKIQNFSGSKSDLEYKRLSSRLCHVSGRISRFVIESDEEESERQRLQMFLLSLEGELAERVAPVISIESSTPVDPNQMNSQTHFSFSNKSTPVYKWGLKKFSGEGSIMAFLEKVESLRISRNCSKEEVFASAGDLFDGQAWTWWYNNHTKGRFEGWEDLVLELKGTFLKGHYDRNLMDEIKSRKQSSKEKVSIFISVMESLFNRLTVVPSEEIIVDIIRENLLPDYVKALALHDIKTISQLQTLCKRLEDTPGFVTTSFRTRFMEPDLTRPMARPQAVCAVEVKCWNCLRTGHTYSQCREPRTCFCYGCGAKGIIKPKCQACSKNVKVTGRQNLDVAASTSFQVQETLEPTPSTSNSRKGKAPKKKNSN